MFSSNNTLSFRQLMALLTLSLFGTAVIYAPSYAVDAAGAAGWLSLALAAVTAAAAAWLIATLSKRFPGASFHDQACGLLSKPVGKALCAVFAIKIIIGAALELRVFAEIIRQYMLPATPLWLMLALTLAIAGYAAGKGREAGGRLAEILEIMVFAPFIILLVLAAVKADFSNLSADFSGSLDEIAWGGYSAGFAFMNIEWLLIGVPFLAAGVGRAKARCKLTLGVLTVGGVMAFMTAAVIARFGAAGVTRRVWPVLEMFFTMNAPVSFIERKEALVLGFWILTCLTVTGAALFLSSHLAHGTIKKGRQTYYVWGTAALVMALALVPRDLRQALDWVQVLYRYTGLLFTLAVPVIMLLITWLRGFIKHAKPVHVDNSGDSGRRVPD